MRSNPTNPTSDPKTGIFEGGSFLSLLNSLGIFLSANGGRIRFDAPAGRFTPELRAMVAEHRDELLKLLASGPQDGDAAGPVAAGSDPSDAGPSGTDRPAGQALPGADPLGAGGPQDDHGDAGQAHGDARGRPGDLAAGGQAGPAAPRTRPDDPVAVEWPAAAADFVLLLTVDDLPPVPFRTNAWTETRDAARMLRWLQADIKRGPSGPRAFYGALQRDLQNLQRFALQAADERQAMNGNQKGGDR